METTDIAVLVSVAALAFEILAAWFGRLAAGDYQKGFHDHLVIWLSRGLRGRHNSGAYPPLCAWRSNDANPC